MKLSNKINLICAFIYLSIVSDPYISYGLSFSITTAFVVFIVILRKKFPAKGTLKFILPIILLLLVGVLGFSNNEYYLFFKDIWYTSKIIIIFFSAFLWFYTVKDFPKIIYTICLAVTTLCGIHLFQLAINPQVWGGSLIRLREIGTGIDGSPYVPLLILYLKQVGYFKTLKELQIKNLILFICIASILLSLSRTQIVILVMSYGTMAMRNNLGYIRYGFTILFAGIFLLTSGALSFEVTVNDVTTNTTLLSKFANSLSEMTFREYETRGENLNNYRGYEAFRGLNMILEAEPKKQLLGHGYGSYLDLSDVLFDLDKNPKIVTFHNAYIQIVMKCGVLGLLLYFFFILKVLFAKVRIYAKRKIDKTLEAILVLSACDMLFSTFVVAGLFGPGNMKITSLIVGSYFAFSLYQKSQGGLEST